MSPLRILTALATAVVLLLVGFALFGERGVQRHEQLRSELERLESMNRALQRKNERLAAERHALRHDPAYIELVIRNDLGYVHPDELVLQFPAD